MKPVYSVVHVGTEGRKRVSRLQNGVRSYLHIFGDVAELSGTIAERTVEALDRQGDYALVQSVESFEPELTVYQGGAGVRRMGGTPLPTAKTYRPMHGGYPGASTYTRAVP